MAHPTHSPARIVSSSVQSTHIFTTCELFCHFAYYNRQSKYQNVYHRMISSIFLQIRHLISLLLTFSTKVPLKYQKPQKRHDFESI
jgi:hypothetical protein